MGPSFRRDIHGLRGIAVLLVLGFHCRLPYFDGGFVGVDVFFVLSGCLIAKQIVKMVGAESLELGQFYARRLTRLCPLLIVCVSAALAVGWALLATEDFVDLAKSSTAAVLGGSNFYYLATLDEGYFGTDTRKLPLLHTWSLGAELQFYLAYPILGIIRTPWLQSILMSSCFLGSVFLFFRDSESGGFAYFMPMARFWQFLLGAAAGSVLESRLQPSSLPEATAPALARQAGMLWALGGVGAMASGLFADKAVSLVGCVSAAAVVAIGSAAEPDRHFQIPAGWAVDAGGVETQTPSEVVPEGGLLPLGGSEKTGGYKGYGLAMLVEVFCGMLSGSTYGPNVRRWMSTERVADLGQCFVAIDPKAFAPGQSVSRDSSSTRTRSTTPELGPQVQAQYVKYFEAELAKKLGVEPMKTL